MSDGLRVGFEKSKELYKNLEARVLKLGQAVASFAGKKLKQTFNLGKRVLGGFADFATGGIFDLDKKGESITDKVSQFPKLKEGMESIVGDVKERGIGGTLGGIADTFTGGVFDFDKKGDTKFQDFQQSAFEKSKETFGVVGEKIEEGRKNLLKGMTNLADKVTGNVFDPDKSGEGKTGILKAITSIADKTASLIGLQNFEGESTKPDSGKGLQPIVQADAPQQSMASLLPTKSPVPFIKVLDNPYLSKVPTRSNTNEIPPEIAKLIA